MQKNKISKNKLLEDLKNMIPDGYSFADYNEITAMKAIMCQILSLSQRFPSVNKFFYTQGDFTGSYNLKSLSTPQLQAQYLERMHKPIAAAAAKKLIDMLLYDRILTPTTVDKIFVNLNSIVVALASEVWFTATYKTFQDVPKAARPTQQNPTKILLSIAIFCLEAGLYFDTSELVRSNKPLSSYLMDTPLSIGKIFFNVGICSTHALQSQHELSKLSSSGGNTQSAPASQSVSANQQSGAQAGKTYKAGSYKTISGVVNNIPSIANKQKQILNSKYVYCLCFTSQSGDKVKYLTVTPVTAQGTINKKWDDMVGYTENIIGVTSAHGYTECILWWEDLAAIAALKQKIDPVVTQTSFWKTTIKKAKADPNGYFEIDYQSTVHVAIARQSITGKAFIQASKLNEQIDETVSEDEAIGVVTEDITNKLPDQTHSVQTKTKKPVYSFYDPDAFVESFNKYQD